MLKNMVANHWPEQLQEAVYSRINNQCSCCLGHKNTNAEFICNGCVAAANYSIKCRRERIVFAIMVCNKYLLRDVAQLIVRDLL
jgi:hypothetical protein